MSDLEKVFFQVDCNVQLIVKETLEEEAQKKGMTLNEFVSGLLTVIVKLKYNQL